MLAFAYVSPITALVHLCDREPGQKTEAIERIDRFIRHFIGAHQTS